MVKAKTSSQASQDKDQAENKKPAAKSKTTNVKTSAKRPARAKTSNANAVKKSASKVELLQADEAEQLGSNTDTLVNAVSDSDGANNATKEAVNAIKSTKVTAKTRSAKTSNKGSAKSSNDNVSKEDGVLVVEDNNKVTTYPLVILRSIITPGANVALIAGRESTVLAMYDALDTHTKIAVFSQTNDTDLRPEKEDLSRYGVLAQVLDGDYNDQDQFRATICGEHRIIIKRIVDDPTDNVRRVEVEVVPSVEVDDNIAKRYLNAVLNALDLALEQQNKGGRNILDRGVPVEMLKKVRKITDLGTLCDALAQLLSLPHYDKNYILETLNPVARAKAIIAYLNNYTYKAETDKKIAEEARAAMDKSQREFYLHEQLKAIKRELNINIDDSSDIDELNNKTEALDAPPEVIARLKKEISRLANMPINSGENSTVRNYIETVLSIPWRAQSTLNRDLGKARDVLEHDHYGLDKVKDRILEFLAVQTRRENVDAHGQILCLMGPPGIGKTSLASSIAKATGRKYVRVALGGMYDESEIRGHRRTYIGSMPGRIIQSMIKCGVNNPLFLLDEIDKVSTNSFHGDISAALLEVLDPEQNKSFNDNYLDLDFDLSHTLFIATANSYNIPPALRDRMEIIDLSSYTADEKFHIAREHLLPKQLVKNGLSESEFDISDAGLKQLITHYTLEAGVRSLERIIGELCRKVVKDLMINPPKNPKKVVLGVKEIEKLIGPKRFDFTSKLKENRVGIVNGLSVSSVGGDILQVEVIANEGKGSHLLTGQLGSVMKESVFASIAWVRSQARNFKLSPSFYQCVDLNLHFPEGAIPKDGPSAGCAITTAIVSALTGNPVRSDVAMTGEITLRGDVLAIGGLKEKLLAALRGGVKTVCIPYDNKKDLWDMPKVVLNSLTIKPVKTIQEVLDIALENDPHKFEPKTLEEWTLKYYLESEHKRKLKQEAEDRKISIEIKDASEASVSEIKNNPIQESEEQPKGPSKGRSKAPTKKAQSC